ncbi:AbfB domain-containing protein [Streptomyces sp. NPDC004232]|uniref:AbfB domain-containing protein n=1 Tax=Streptomyces sp. NPDC004232 TaxID=3154454 RepID=UPI001DFFAB44|nr:AbfB domain-containing protein [Streptomyces sp. tea 10]
MPDHTPRPWENGWNADTSRTPGTRRLWLAGALALATVVACVTAIALDGTDPGPATAPAAAGAPTDHGPGLLSFASPSTRTASPPKGTGTAPSTAPQSAVSPSAEPPASPAKSPPGHGSSQHPPKPAARGTSVRSVNYPDRYWHISGDYVNLDPVVPAADRSAASFTVVKGLADSSCYSFTTSDGGYLRHRNFLLRAEQDDGTALFRQDATFCPRPSPCPGATMLESVNYPGRFLRHQNFRLKLDPYQNTDLYRADSAFLLVDTPA